MTRISRRQALVGGAAALLGVATASTASAHQKVIRRKHRANELGPRDGRLVVVDGPDTVSGKVESASGGVIVLRTAFSPVQVVVTPETKIFVDGFIELDAVKVGDELAAEGTWSEDGSFLARWISPLFRLDAGTLDSIDARALQVGGRRYSLRRAIAKIRRPFANQPPAAGQEVHVLYSRRGDGSLVAGLVE